MLVIFALLLLSTRGLSDTVTRFSKVECEMLDPSYATYKECHLKELGSGIEALNIYAKLNKGPFNNAKVSLSLWRKYKEYRPFMFNMTFDFCKFMAESDKKLSIQKIFIDMLAEKSNLNHSCPYEHALIVRDLVLKEEFFKFFPIPSGQYKFQLMGATNNHWKTFINVNLYVKEIPIKIEYTRQEASYVTPFFKIA